MNVLGAKRRTQVKHEDGKLEILEDDWTEKDQAHQPFSGYGRWTGRATFEQKQSCAPADAKILSPLIKQNAGKINEGAKKMGRITELPKSAWTLTESSRMGTQFFSRFKIDGQFFQVMLDGGSALNTIPEQTLLDIINSCRAKGLKMGAEGHPVKALERFQTAQEVRGVAAGATIPIMGAVVLEMELTEYKKQRGPKALFRLKICELGKTDWRPIILGALCIDCTERGASVSSPARIRTILQHMISKLSGSRGTRCGTRTTSTGSTA